MKRGYIILLTIIASSGQSFSYQTENVFVVAIDGIRNNEAFEAGSTYIKHIWNDLRPLGTIYTNFWNTSCTYTTPGHTTILSGVSQIMPNNFVGIDYADLRSKDPSFYEYYRKEKNIPQEKAGAVTGKTRILRYIDQSLEPGYGAYPGFIKYGSDSNDIITWDTLRTVMDTKHPSLVYVVFAQVDGAGHTGNFTQYTNSIIQADSLIWELWKKIQSDSTYKDKTTMFITTDHGRHDDGWLTGFKDHMDFCHGCRHIPFLAIGPDIKQGIVETRRREQIDICPTVGELLGFKTQYAQGNVLSEMLRIYEGKNVSRGIFKSGETNISNTPGFSGFPDFTIDKNGRFHVVWAEKEIETWKILYRRSIDFGSTWEPARTIFSSSQDSVFLFPKIASDSSLFIGVAGYGFYPFLTRDTSALWRIWGAISEDGGSTWSTKTLGTAGMVTTSPGIAVRGRDLGLVWMVSGSTSFLQDSLYTKVYFKQRRGGVWLDSVRLTARPDSVGFFLNPSLILSDTLLTFANTITFYMGTPQMKNWEISYYRSRDRGVSFGKRRFLTTDPLGDYFYDYDISSSIDRSMRIHTVWARRSEAGTGRWQVAYKKSTNYGLNWTPLDYISTSQTGAWQADITNSGDSVLSSWTDYREGMPKIFARTSTDGGTTWGTEQKTTQNDSFASSASIASFNGKFYLVWQDNRNNNWEIYFKEVPFPTGVEEIEISNLKLQNSKLFQNYPNPFSKSTSIRFQIQSSNLKSSNLKSGVSIKIYDIQGRLIREFPITQLLNYPITEVTWSGKDSSGKDLPNGIYFYRLEADNFSDTKKMILLR